MMSKMGMKIDRIACGTFALAAALLCACGSDRDRTDRAGRDTSAQPPAAAPDTSSTTPASPAAGDSLDATRWVLRGDGLGPVRVGMTVAEADRATGGLDRTAGLESCDYVRPKRRPARGSFLVGGGR